MIESPRILVVDPHPDDESFFWGGTIAKYAKQGAEIYLLVLSNGEKGKISITHSEKGFQGFREAKTLEDQEWLAAERQKECEEAVNLLGIKHVEFLGIPNLEVNQSAIIPIKTVIKNFDPHVVFSFNEAGTFSPVNQDHSWAGIATYGNKIYINRLFRWQNFARRRVKPPTSNIFSPIFNLHFTSGRAIIRTMGRNEFK